MYATTIWKYFVTRFPWYFKKNVLFSGSIYDNIRWGDEHASEEEVRRVCKLAQADGFVSEFPDGYDTMIVQGR